MPDLPTFAVDDGFSYRIPEALTGVTVGSLVRIPLGGRRVRGVVTHVREGEDSRRLKDIAAVVGDFPILTPRLLETLRWASIHYVAPLSVMLAKPAPPNIARRRTTSMASPASAVSPLPEATRAAAAGGRVRSAYLVGGGPWGGTVSGLVADVLAAGRNAAVIAPTVVEATAIAREAGTRLGIDVPVVTSSAAAAEVTAIWADVQQRGGHLLVGTRETAFWPMGDMGMMIVVEEGRPAMTAPETPTVSVRDIVRRRAVAERFVAVFAGPVPTVEVMAAGVDLYEPPARAWPLVEVADRSEEPPGGGVVMQATVRAIAGVLKRDERVFVFVSRRGDAAAFRCVRCGELRRCATCDTAAMRGDVCQRCGAALGDCGACGGTTFQALGAGVGRVVAELRRSFAAAVGTAQDEAQVMVGTERDLPSVAGVALSVVIDADVLVLAPHYRAEEDALRTFARVALTVERGRGRRCLIQTSQPTHRVFSALRSGRPTDLLRVLLHDREQAGFPPVAELLAVEVRNPPPTAGAALQEVADGVAVMGPAPLDDGQRWLISGGDLRPFKLRLRSIVQGWRDAGAKVRVDADPVRL